MRPHTVRQLLFIIALLGVGLGSMRMATSGITLAAQYGTYAVLVLATLGAMVSGFRNGAWSGFAVLGWAYFLPLFVLATPAFIKECPTSRLVSRYASTALPPAVCQGYTIITGDEDWPKVSYLADEARGLSANSELFTVVASYNQKLDNATVIGQCILTLFFAFVGSLIGRKLQFLLVHELRVSRVAHSSVRVGITAYDRDHSGDR